LTGQTQGFEIYRKTTTGWIGGAGLTVRFRDSSLGFNYSRSLQAGNGVYLSSVSDLAGISYGLRLRRTWAASVNVSYSKLGALSQTIGQGAYYAAGGSLSRRLNSYVNFIGSGGYFRTNVFNGRFSRDRYYASVGVQISPWDLPILR
jgi:hypothetical protein